MTQVSVPERDRGVDALEVVLAGAADDELAAPLAPLAPAPGSPASPTGSWPVSDRRVADHLCRGARRDDPAAVLAGAGPEVDQVVGGAHRPLVVLDDDHRVAEVAEPLERPDQLRVVALVQPDRGLVEDVEDADQAGADLGREPDPLRLAARQRRRRPLQRQVADPDRDEELEPLLRPRGRPAWRSPARSRSAPETPIHSSASRAERFEYSAIERPPTVTARLSGRSRAPSQAGHGCSAIRPSIRSRVFSESVFA